MRIQILAALAATAIAVSATAQIKPVDPNKLRPQGPIKVRPTPTPLIRYRLTVTYRNTATLTYRVYTGSTPFSCPGAESPPPVLITCTADFPAGTAVTLHASWTMTPRGPGAPVVTRSEPVKKEAWGGDCAGATSPTPTVTMNSAKSCTVAL